MSSFMYKWPGRHRNLLAVVILLIIACLLYGFLRLKPRWQIYKDMVEEKQATEERITKFEWPKDFAALEKKRQDFKRILEKDNGSGKGLEQEAQEFIEKSTSLFKGRIEDEYGSVQDFMLKASQTEYKDQYDRLDTYFQGKGINIDPVVFGMDELTSDTLKYQMLLKLWTTQAVVDCALNTGMRVRQQRLGGGNRGRQAAQLHVCKMQSYYLEEKDAEPYLLEFPVQMELTGNMESLTAFVDALYTGGRFLPVTKLEIVTSAPNPRQAPRPDAQGRFTVNGLVVRVVCSSFFLRQQPKEIKVKSTGPATGGTKPPGL